MSYSSKIKAELEKIFPSARHCQLAEMTALGFADKESAKRKYFALRGIAFDMEADGHSLTSRAERQADKDAEAPDTVDPLLLQKDCCRRAYLRGLFLATGSMSDPESGYHLEFAVGRVACARQLMAVLAGFEIEGRLTKRKNRCVVYIRDGASIVLLLNVIGAHEALLDLENLRVEKEVRNFVNRQVNCEAANISKTITAASRQIEDIIYIRDHLGFSALSPKLRHIAEMRLEYPELSLADLGAMFDPPLGKSGVNHRLRKLSEIRESCEAT